jgi:HSP20 family protein
MDLMKWEGRPARDIWDAFDGLRSDMDRALDLFKVPDASGLLDRTTAPAVDVVETDEDFVVVADLPGVKRDDIELSVTGTLLSIRGDKKGEAQSDKRKIFRKETWVGSFNRTIDLPADIDPDKVQAELKDGVLTVRVAKREEAKTKTIAVSVR